jgi:hypothetical protein
MRLNSSVLFCPVVETWWLFKVVVQGGGSRRTDPVSDPMNASHERA